MNEWFKDNLNDLKEYCYGYIARIYGKKQNYIRKTRITKNGLFIYGHNVYSPLLGKNYTIYIFISWYDSNYYEYINTILDCFVKDCIRLKESE